jgi:DNA-binding CsgD family transcriptional regulator
MSDPTSSSPPARRRVVPRQKRAHQAERMFALLRGGMAVWDIARAENCSVRTVRRIIADSLARLEIDPTAGYAQLQIARLNDALLIAHDKMLEGNLQALDRVLKVIESQDRYHGFGSIGGAAPVDADRARLTRPDRPRRLAKPAEVRRLAPPEMREEVTSAGEDATSEDKIQVATS